ncbi:hypothetical protein CF319_g1696, partial [Tilletia indica]
NVPVPAQGTPIILALSDHQARDFDEGDMERRRFNLKKALRTAFHVADEATEIIFRREDENAHGQDTALLLAVPAAHRRDTVSSDFRERAGAANEGSTANIILAIPDLPRKRDDLQNYGLRSIQLLDITQSRDLGRVEAGLNESNQVHTGKGYTKNAGKPYGDNFTLPSKDVGKGHGKKHKAAGTTQGAGYISSYKVADKGTGARPIILIQAPVKGYDK